jgi:hypothetical protein
MPLCQLANGILDLVCCRIKYGIIPDFHSFMLDFNRIMPDFFSFMSLPTMCASLLHHSIIIVDPSKASQQPHHHSRNGFGRIQGSRTQIAWRYLFVNDKSLNFHCKNPRILEKNQENRSIRAQNFRSFPIISQLIVDYFDQIKRGL